MAVDDRAVPLRSDSPVQLAMVNVIAPATLPAGYEFEAQVQNDPEMTVHAVVVGESRVEDTGHHARTLAHFLFLSIACRWCGGRRSLSGTHGKDYIPWTSAHQGSQGPLERFFMRMLQLRMLPPESMVCHLLPIQYVYLDSSICVAHS